MVETCFTLQSMPNLIGGRVAALAPDLLYSSSGTTALTNDAETLTKRARYDAGAGLFSVAPSAFLNPKQLLNPQQNGLCAVHSTSCQTTSFQPQQMTLKTPCNVTKMLVAGADSNGLQSASTSSCVAGKCNSTTTDTQINGLTPKITSTQRKLSHRKNNGDIVGSAPETVSRVVHLRNIPSDMTELELVHFCMPFGQLANYLMLKGKNQAFVEYMDERSARSIVDVAETCPMTIRARTICCQYSTHRELKTTRKPASKEGSLLGPGHGLGGSLVTATKTDGGALNMSNLLALSGPTQKNGNVSPITEGGGVGSDFVAIGNGDSTSASQLDISGSGTQQQPNTVLRVIIDNMLYAITLDIFSRYGKVLRIITFNKNNTFQALIQMSEAHAAQSARLGLDGQNVYNGCCTLRIDYSKLATLNIKYNNEKSRDYTNPTLPGGEISFEQQLSLVTAAASQNQLNNHVNSIMSHGGFTTFPLTSAANSFFQPQQTLLQSSDVINSVAAAAAAANSGAGAHANASNISPFFSFNAANNFAAAAAAAAVAAAAASNPQAGAANAAAAALNFPQLTHLIGSPVILVSNLDENKITPDALFTLFGVYGDVHRVKILFNRKNSALIQFAESQQAYLATQHLDKVKWHGKVIRITTSKHTNVQMPKEGQPDSGLTRDYTNSPLHRFKKPGSKNYMNIYAPSSTLHLSNIPPSITEDFLTNAFEEKSFPVKMLKFFQNDHKMALVQLESVDQAISALTQMHNFKLANNAHLRVSFSKKGLSVDTR